jgi:hypothetical protein
MKTVQDYLNDPMITGDPGLMSSPEEIKTIHAIQLKQQDETVGMSFEEKAAFHRKRPMQCLPFLGCLSRKWFIISKADKISQ